MILAPHMMVGGIIGDLVDNIPLALLIGIISHFVFDAIPHLETSTFKSYFGRKEGDKLVKAEMIFEVFEIIIGLILIYFFWKNHQYQWPIFFGALGAILPDLIDNVPFWSWKLRKYPIFKQTHWLHENLHFDLKPRYWYLGLPVYIVIILALIMVW